VLESVFQIVVPPEWFDENSKHGTNLCKELQVGSFSLIIDEAHTDIMENAKKVPSNKYNKGNLATLWK